MGSIDSLMGGLSMAVGGIAAISLSSWAASGS